ncbi:PaaX family transcriptional regulator C-terminal domain-containing protein [Microbacterium sp. zg-Y818]|uniref:PaaX family transcriptional regulator n=1 Tax=unclassified Microbacterium TaxID=2609290 RepID=UPI00214AC57F|nr:MULTISPECIES: PaaX family transcriptional regulator C-terminal domain-containing protein [unclassified Microbacterium]MCR2799466.1 PaaX family transcriptional regulator [Microbacterium sp. zg.Y818]WIM21463.1 PaaX family transcriptional regulator C-terminal domain-containing protein [Microbacterium sp. zg-Y818]
MSEVLPPARSVRRRSPVLQVLTLFGDYWWGVKKPLPTGAILAAMADLGVKQPAARAALVRMTQDGILEVSRAGRRTSHALASRGAELVREEAGWLRRFGRIEPEWDGCWSVLMFSIPEAERALRHRARAILRWSGYAPLYDGVWISPTGSVEDTTAQLRAAGVLDVTSLRAPLAMTSTDGPLRAWGIAAVRQEYARFLDRLAAGPRTEAGGAALATRTDLMLDWQAFRHIDPGHPARLLPADWPRAAARGVFVRTYDALGESAEERMRDHVRAVDDALAAFVTPQRLGEEDAVQ